MRAGHAVFRATRGVPRLINLICDTALVYAFGSEMRRIDEALVTEVVKDKRQGGLFFADGIAGVSARGASIEPGLPLVENVTFRASK